MQATSPPADADKPTWRRWLRQRLRQIDDAPAQARAVRAHLLAHLNRSPALRIAAFAAMPGEIDLLPLLANSRHHWHFPRIADDRLTFHELYDPADLAPDTFGIDAPRADRPVTDIAGLDLILVPGLGFARDGSRLGRGRGFYDRALAHTRPDAPRIAIAFREQIVDQLPTEDHDLPMTHLLTATGLEPTASLP